MKNWCSHSVHTVFTQCSPVIQFTQCSHPGKFTDEAQGDWRMHFTCSKYSHTFAPFKSRPTAVLPRLFMLASITFRLQLHLQGRRQSTVDMSALIKWNFQGGHDHALCSKFKIQKANLKAYRHNHPHPMTPTSQESDEVLAWMRVGCFPFRVCST